MITTSDACAANMAMNSAGTGERRLASGEPAMVGGGPVLVTVVVFTVASSISSLRRLWTRAPAAIGGTTQLRLALRPHVAANT